MSYKFFLLMLCVTVSFVFQTVAVSPVDDLITSTNYTAEESDGYVWHDFIVNHSRPDFSNITNLTRYYDHNISIIVNSSSNGFGVGTDQPVYHADWEEDKAGNLNMEETYSLELNDGSIIGVSQHYSENINKTRIHLTYENPVKIEECKSLCERKDKACKESCVNAYTYDMYRETIGLETISIYDTLVLVGYI